ncbi:hypothetical protein RRG08_042074 [Elysia crispata]|uniref:Uncharacterized protein n=1 Tax=Elysia crispata TaxID=231223 RepID=A0AAE0Z4A5_9GAST|nr:hypothetical protein RRG08_042074 [Elysia crispata]
MFTRTPNFALVTLMILGVSAQHEGLEFSLVRTESSTDDKLCSQLICRVQGMSVFIDDVTISKASVDGVSRKLMTTSTNSPESSIVGTTTKGNGTLKDNSATLFIDFLSCESDFIICEVTYTDGSNQKENAFMIAGLGKHSKFLTASQNRIHKNDGVTSTHTKVVSSKASNIYSPELWHLGDKIIKIEDKFETLKDRLDRRLNQNIDTVNRRANTLENSVLGRVSSVETDFSSRFSRLEDRVSSIL